MTLTPRPVLFLTLLALVLCFFSVVEATPRKPRPTKSSSTSTTCTPTATATNQATLTFGANPTGSPGDGTQLIFGSDWLYIACAGYTSNSCPGDCLPACCNKGACGPSSTTTDLLLSSPLFGNPASPNLYILPRAPAVGFTLFDVTFTAAYFLDQWPSVTVEIKGESVYSTQTPPIATIIIPKPSYGTYYSSVTVNLPLDLQLGSLKRLDFLAYFTGSDGSGGQGPNGRVLAEVRMDADGTGAGIRYETYTPQGCERRYKREEGVSVPPMVLVRRSLEGNVYDFPMRK